MRLLSPFWAAGLSLVAAASVQDWTASSEWKRALRNRPVGSYMLLDLHAPWCSHCKRLLPDLEAAAEAVSQWDLGENRSVTVATIDCIQAKRLCAGYGVISYPTVKLADWRSSTVADLPRGPRNKESLLSFLAENLRDTSPIRIEDEAAWENAKRELFESCSQDQEKMSLSLNASICRFARSSNYLIGMADQLNQLNRVFPNLARAMLQFEIAKPMLGLEREGAVCILDRYGLGAPRCLAVNGTDSEIRAAHADTIKAHRAPLIVKGGNWEDFYRLRNIKGQFVLVVAMARNHINNYEEWENALVKVAETKKSQWNFMHVDSNDGNVMRIFTQLDVSTDPLPALVAFTDNVENRKYFVFESGKLDELDQWLDQVRSGRLKGEYPDGYNPGFFAILSKELRDLWRGFRRGLNESGPLALCLLGSMLVSIAVAIVYVFVMDQSPSPSSRANLEGATRVPSEKGEETETETPSAVEGPIGAEGELRQRKVEEKH